MIDKILINSKKELDDTINKIITINKKLYAKLSDVYKIKATEQFNIYKIEKNPKKYNIIDFIHNDTNKEFITIELEQLLCYFVILIKLKKSYKVEKTIFADSILNILETGSVSKKMEIIILYDLTDIIAKNAYTIFGSDIIQKAAQQLGLTEEEIANILKKNKSSVLIGGGGGVIDLTEYFKGHLMGGVTDMLMISGYNIIMPIIYAYITIPYQAAIFSVLTLCFKMYMQYRAIDRLLPLSTKTTISKYITYYYNKVSLKVIEYTKLYLLSEEKIPTKHILDDVILTLFGKEIESEDACIKAKLSLFKTDSKRYLLEIYKSEVIDLFNKVNKEQINKNCFTVDDKYKSSFYWPSYYLFNPNKEIKCDINAMNYLRNILKLDKLFSLNDYDISSSNYLFKYKQKSYMYIFNNEKTLNDDGILYQTEKFIYIKSAEKFPFALFKNLDLLIFYIAHILIISSPVFSINQMIESNVMMRRLNDHIPFINEGIRIIKDIVIYILNFYTSEYNKSADINFYTILNLIKSFFSSPSSGIINKDNITRYTDNIVDNYHTYTWSPEKLRKFIKKLFIEEACKKYDAVVCNINSLLYDAKQSTDMYDCLQHKDTIKDVVDDDTTRENFGKFIDMIKCELNKMAQYSSTLKYVLDNSLNFYYDINNGLYNQCGKSTSEPAVIKESLSNLLQEFLTTGESLKDYNSYYNFVITMKILYEYDNKKTVSEGVENVIKTIIKFHYMMICLYCISNDTNYIYAKEGKYGDMNIYNNLNIYTLIDANKLYDDITRFYKSDTLLFKKNTMISDKLLFYKVKGILKKKESSFRVNNMLGLKKIDDYFIEQIHKIRQKQVDILKFKEIVQEIDTLFSEFPKNGYFIGLRELYKVYLILLYDVYNHNNDQDNRILNGYQENGIIIFNIINSNSIINTVSVIQDGINSTFGIINNFEFNIPMSILCYHYNILFTNYLNMQELTNISNIIKYKHYLKGVPIFSKGQIHYNVFVYIEDTYKIKIDTTHLHYKNTILEGTKYKLYRHTDCKLILDDIIIIDDFIFNFKLLYDLYIKFVNYESNASNDINKRFDYNQHVLYIRFFTLSYIKQNNKKIKEAIKTEPMIFVLLIIILSDSKYIFINKEYYNNLIFAYEIDISPITLINEAETFDKEQRFMETAVFNYIQLNDDKLNMKHYYKNNSFSKHLHEIQVIRYSIKADTEIHVSEWFDNIDGIIKEIVTINDINNFDNNFFKKLLIDFSLSSKYNWLKEVGFDYNSDTNTYDYDKIKYISLDYIDIDSFTSEIYPSDLKLLLSGLGIYSFNFDKYLLLFNSNNLSSNGNNFEIRNKPGKFFIFFEAGKNYLEFNYIDNKIIPGQCFMCKGKEIKCTLQFNLNHQKQPFLGLIPIYAPYICYIDKANNYYVTTIISSKESYTIYDMRILPSNIFLSTDTFDKDKLDSLYRIHKKESLTLKNFTDLKKIYKSHYNFDELYINIKKLLVILQIEYGDKGKNQERKLKEEIIELFRDSTKKTEFKSVANSFISENRLCTSIKKSEIIPEQFKIIEKTINIIKEDIYNLIELNDDMEQYIIKNFDRFIVIMECNIILKTIGLMLKENNSCWDIQFHMTSLKSILFFNKKIVEEYFYGFEIFFLLQSEYFFKESQMVKYKEILTDLIDENSELKLHQFMMGKGKTSVFTPLLILATRLLKNKNPVIITAPHLVKATENIILFSKSMLDIKCDVLSDFDAKERWLNPKQTDDLKNDYNIIDEFDSHHNYLQSMFNYVSDSMTIPHEIINNVFDFTNYMELDEQSQAEYDEKSPDTIDSIQRTKVILYNSLMNFYRIAKSMKYKEKYGFSFEYLEKEKNDKHRLCSPFLRKDTPIQNSQFSSILLTLILTFIEYIKNGLQDSDYNNILRNPSILTELKTKLNIQKEIPEVLTLDNIKTLIPDPKNIDLIKEYLFIVNKEKMKITTKQQNLSFQDIIYNNHNQWQVGYTGTASLTLNTYNHEDKFVFRDIIPDYDENVEIMLALKGYSCPHTYNDKVSIIKPKDEIDTILKQIVTKLSDNPRGFVDLAGVFIEYDNKDIAKKLKKIFDDNKEKKNKESANKEKVEIDKEPLLPDRKIVYLDKKQQGTEYDNTTPKRYTHEDENNFYYYDQCNTVGTDLKQPRTGHVAIIINYKTRWTDFAQAIFRFRKLNRGTYLSIFLISDQDRKLYNIDMYYLLMCNEDQFNTNQLYGIQYQLLKTMIRKESGNYDEIDLLPDFMREQFEGWDIKSIFFYLHKNINGLNKYIDTLYKSYGSDINHTLFYKLFGRFYGNNVGLSESEIIKLVIGSGTEIALQQEQEQEQEQKQEEEQEQKQNIDLKQEIIYINLYKLYCILHNGCEFCIKMNAHKLFKSDEDAYMINGKPVYVSYNLSLDFIVNIYDKSYTLCFVEFTNMILIERLDVGLDYYLYKVPVYNRKGQEFFPYINKNNNNKLNTGAMVGIMLNILPFPRDSPKDQFDAIINQNINDISYLLLMHWQKFNAPKNIKLRLQDDDDKIEEKLKLVFKNYINESHIQPTPYEEWYMKRYNVQQRTKIDVDYIYFFKVLFSYGINHIIEREGDHKEDITLSKIYYNIYTDTYTDFPYKKRFLYNDNTSYVWSSKRGVYNNRNYNSNYNINNEPFNEPYIQTKRESFSYTTNVITEITTNFRSNLF